MFFFSFENARAFPFHLFSQSFRLFFIFRQNLCVVERCTFCNTLASSMFENVIFISSNSCFHIIDIQQPFFSFIAKICIFDGVDFHGHSQHSRRQFRFSSSSFISNKSHAKAFSHFSISYAKLNGITHSLAPSGTQTLGANDESKNTSKKIHEIQYSVTYSCKLNRSCC